MAFPGEDERPLLTLAVSRGAKLSVGRQALDDPALQKDWGDEIHRLAITVDPAPPEGTLRQTYSLVPNP